MVALLLIPLTAPSAPASGAAGPDGSFVGPANETLQCAPGAPSKTPWSFTVQFQFAGPPGGRLVAVAPDRAPIDVGGRLPAMVGAGLQPPWEIESVLQRGYPPPHWAAALGSSALLPLGSVAMDPGDDVRVAVGLATPKSGTYTVAGFTIWARVGGREASAVVRTGLMLSVGSSTPSCSSTQGNRISNRLLTFLASLPAAASSVPPSGGPGGPAAPLPQLIAGGTATTKCGRVPVATCKQLVSEYLGLFGELYRASARRSPQVPRQLVPWLDPLGTQGARALLALYVARRPRWPGLPDRVSLRPRLTALPAAGIDELADCPWPDPLVPGAAHRVTILLAFDKPASARGVWRMSEAWVYNYDRCV